MEGIRAGEAVSEYDARSYRDRRTRRDRRGRLRLMPTPEELVILRQVHPQRFSKSGRDKRATKPRMRSIKFQNPDGPGARRP
eukprot:4711127-Alexandrium_andersonii.AAC.1